MRGRTMIPFAPQSLWLGMIMVNPSKAYSNLGTVISSVTFVFGLFIENKMRKIFEYCGMV